MQLGILPMFQIHASPKNLIRTFFDFATKGPKYDVLYVWFAGLQAVVAAAFAKLFHKKMVLLSVENKYKAANFLIIAKHRDQHVALMSTEQTSR